MKRGINKTCLKCNKEFYVYPYLMATNKGYCSLKCGLKGEDKRCNYCHNSFYALPGSLRREWGLYCSHSCSSRSRDNTLHLGRYAKKGTLAPRTSFKKGQTRFKGTIKEYKQLHYRIGLLLGKPNICTNCDKIASGRQIDWANISGEYKEDPDDWIRLCKKCHWNYDKQYERMYNEFGGETNAN